MLHTRRNSESLWTDAGLRHTVVRVQPQDTGTLVIQIGDPKTCLVWFFEFFKLEGDHRDRYTVQLLIAQPHQQTISYVWATDTLPELLALMDEYFNETW